MTRHLNCVFAAFWLLTACGGNGGAPETPAAVTSADAPAAQAVEAYTPPDSATMMKNWEAYMTPGDMHKMMASWDGTWDQEITWWMVPGGPPQTSKSVVVNKTIMGGRYQVSNTTGTAMGMPFEGMGTLAYDNAKKVFISTWIDNMGTGLMTIEGPWDAANKTVTLTGKMVDGAAGSARQVDVKQIVKIVDDNTQVLEMYAPGPDGKEFKTMELKAVRKK